MTISRSRTGRNRGLLRRSGWFASVNWPCRGHCVKVVRTDARPSCGLCGTCFSQCANPALEIAQTIHPMLRGQWRDLPTGRQPACFAELQWQLRRYVQAVAPAAVRTFIGIAGDVSCQPLGPCRAVVWPTRCRLTGRGADDSWDPTLDVARILCGHRSTRCLTIR